MSYLNVQKSTCYHEAGHAIAWMALTGEAPHNICRGLFSAAVEVCENPNQPLPDGYEPQACIQILAGPIAHAKLQGRKFQQIWDSSVCWSDNETLEELGVEVTDELIEAATAIIKTNWKLVKGLAQELIANDGDMDAGRLWKYWLPQVEPANCDALLKELAKATTAKREADLATKPYVKVWDNDFDETLTFIIDPDEECYEGEWLLHFAWDDVGEEADVAELLETATGIKADMEHKLARREDTFETYAQDIVRAFFEQSERYRVLKHSPDLAWVKPTSKKKEVIAAE